MDSAESSKNGNHSSVSSGAGAKMAAMLNDATSKIDVAMGNANERVAHADEWFRALSKARPLTVIGVALLCGFVAGKIVSTLGGGR